VDLPVAHRRALDATRDRVAAIREDQWDLPTPCDDWNVRAVVNHVVAGNWWASMLAAGSTIDEVGDRFDGDLISDGAIAAYDASAAAADEVFSAPGAMQAPCAVSYGPVPGEIYCGHRFVDVLIHGWDLATATGQPTELDPDLADACLSIVEPQVHLFAATGVFATNVAVPPRATTLEHLLALVGRSA
jgi:uncharacterized protein (TIGR03086 family)